MMSLGIILLIRDAEAMKKQPIVKGKSTKVHVSEGVQLIVDFSDIHKQSSPRRRQQAFLASADSLFRELPHDLAVRLTIRFFKNRAS